MYEKSIGIWCFNYGIGVFVSVGGSYLFDRAEKRCHEARGECSDL